MNRQEFFIDHDGLRIHAKLDFPAAEAEKYPLVIIVHGYTGHMEEDHIIAIAQALTQNGFAALRVEMYGHGCSDGEFRNHTVLKWVSELLTVIDYAAGLDFVEELYLTGHSQGGLTVMLAAAMKRDVLKAVIPLAPAVIIRDAAREGKMFGASFDPDHVPEELDMGEGRVLGGNYFRVAQLLPVEEAQRLYKGPVLLVHADTDESVPLFYSQEAAKVYANAQLKIIHGDDHCYTKKTSEMTDAVVNFLKQVHGK